jgi:16S rRNA G527 N7-methylase RsmG
MSTFSKELVRKCAGFYRLSSAQAGVFEAHFELMTRWNRSLNLTRITDLNDAVERHYAESLFLAAHLPAGISTVVDIGSGAGFPGFPVAVARPDLKVTLVESDQRKAAFLRETSDLASNIEVLAVRAEVLDRQFDLVISRAVQPKEVWRAARRCGRSVAMLLAEEDGRKLKIADPRLIALPYHPGGVLLVADVPRGTSK